MLTIFGRKNARGAIGGPYVEGRIVNVEEDNDINEEDDDNVVMKTICLLLNIIPMTIHGGLTTRM